MSSRTLAAKLISLVVKDKQSLSKVFAECEWSKLTSRDQAFVRELCLGSLRFFERLEKITQLLLFKPLPKKHTDLLVILISALYQLIYLKTPPHAAITESVNAVPSKKKWARGLINKTLRMFVEKEAHFLKKADQQENALYAHPSWLVEQLKIDWPNNFQNILAANNQKAPLFIRTNPHLISRNDYLSKLQAAKIKASPIESLPFGIQLTESLPPHALPGFESGLVYIQDIAGQHAAQLLKIDNNMSVLDACAAPGGKTTDLLASYPQISKLTALDKDPARLEKISENLTRLQLETSKVTLLAADACDLKTWWDGKSFDRILLDVPCSATGVIRRHPDIKVLRNAADVPELAKQQQKLLTSLWGALAPSGFLLYTSCSVLKEENEAVIRTFLGCQIDAQTHPLSIPNAHPLEHGVQLLPTQGGSDGFYYCLLNKAT